MYNSGDLVTSTNQQDINNGLHIYEVINKQFLGYADADDGMYPHYTYTIKDVESGRVVERELEELHRYEVTPLL